VGKTKVFYVVFLRDVACQKLLNSANVSRSCSQNNTGTVFFETRCICSSNALMLSVGQQEGYLTCKKSCSHNSNGLAHAISVHLLPLSGTHCRAAFISVNLEQLSGNTLKRFISNLHFMARPATHYPSASDSVFDIGTL